MAPPNLKKMIQVKIKPRQDSYTDQFSRIFMVKMLMLTAAVTGITWMKDKVTCIIPKSHDGPVVFIQKSCWINGFYIFKDLKPQDMSYYYGIPEDISKDGYNRYGSLCATKTQHGRPVDDCTPLSKTFFLQYQWFPLAVAGIAFIYYLPYLLFRVVNTDLQEINDLIKGKNADNVNYDKIITRFFIRKNNSTSHLHARVLLNFVVKILYIISNVIGMIFVDSSINHDFMRYGPSWNAWTELSHEEMHDYTDPKFEKAGHELLPSFGLCQVFTTARDIKTEVKNVHTYVCELSQHVLYQYILIIMWYMFVFGIIISVLGVIQHGIKQSMAFLAMNTQGEEVKNIYREVSVREKEYLEFIRRKNLPIFSAVLKKVKQINEDNRRYSSSGSDRSSFSPPASEKEKLIME